MAGDSKAAVSIPRLLAGAARRIFGLPRRPRSRGAPPPDNFARVTERLRDIASPPPSRSLVLCTDERSGSHYLAELLAATGRLGRAYEYFNTHWMREHYADYPEDVPGQFLWAKRLGTTPNGVFGLKLHPWAMDRVSPFIDLGADLPDPRFVLLRRRDLLGQAISLQKAQSTQVFTSWSEKRGEPVYDGARIRALLTHLAARRERWELYFARNGIEPLRVDYETCVGEPRQTVARIAAHLGIALRPGARVAEWYRFEPQCDALNDAWRQHFLAEFGDTRFLDPLPLSGPPLRDFCAAPSAP